MAEVVRSFLGRAARYGLAGALNGAVSLSLIALLDLGLRLRPELANAAGYGAGVLMSFALTRSFVFRNNAHVGRTGPRYLLIVATGFALNQLALQAMLRFLGPGQVQHALAQLTGIATYSGFVFLACQLWVFRAREDVAGGPAQP
jgi:putative flippase GtrA